MNQLISCIESAKEALHETKTVVMKVKREDNQVEEIEQEIKSLEHAKKAMKFMAGYAFKVPSQG